MFGFLEGQRDRTRCEGASLAEIIAATDVYTQGEEPYAEPRRWRHRRISVFDVLERAGPQRNELGQNRLFDAETQNPAFEAWDQGVIRGDVTVERERQRRVRIDRNPASDLRSQLEFPASRNIEGRLVDVLRHDSEPQPREGTVHRPDIDSQRG